MKKIITAAILLAVLLSGCSLPDISENTGESEITYSEGAVEKEKSGNTENGCVPLNYRDQTGLWLPYLDFPDYMAGKTEEEYRRAVNEILDEAAAEGVNTIYFHVHPAGDAYYSSEIFPKGAFYDGEYDPLEIMLEEAHSKGISLHAWLNPLRLQTEEEMANLPDNFIIKKWIAEGSPNVKLVNGRWYLDPSQAEVTELINSAAAEILQSYCVDGIHIDDYFYPTTDVSFDEEEFAKSGSTDLADWRRKNIDRMVKGLYDTVKGYGADIKFGVSPQGNIDTDYNSQFADVALWAGSDGYVDYIVPQIYFGFENAVCPFEPTLRKWEKLVENSGVSLIIGLADYKQGKYDQWAGAAGENEWIDSPDVIPRQIELVKSSTADGYALYK